MPKLTEKQKRLINDRIDAWNREQTQKFIDNRIFLERYEIERLKKRKWNTILVEQEVLNEISKNRP